MGGRGAKARRTVPYGANTKRELNNIGVGGGAFAPKVRSAAGGGDSIDTPLGKMEVVSFSHNGSKWRAPNKNDGQLVLRDSKGKEYRSIQVGTGSTRATYEFKDFALKFEGVVKGGYAGQNSKDVKAYNNLHPRLKQYAARPLSSNQTVTLKVNGSMKKVQVIAVERIQPYTGKISERQYAQLKRQYDRLVHGKRKNRVYGKGIHDLQFPDREGKNGYNVYFAKKKNGKLILKAYDIPLGQ